MSARKIEAWHQAGVIDAVTRERLIAYEAEHARPLLLWAVFGIGALAVGLGLVSVVAANWEEIPGTLRLAVHLALIAAMLAVLGWRERDPGSRSPYVAEALLFIAAALGLTFFGHLGQVYQTASPLWQPLALWLILFAPLLLAMGRGTPAAAALMGVAVWAAWVYVDASGQSGTARETGWRMWLAFVLALPVMFAPLAAGMRSRSPRSGFWRRLEQLACAYGVGGSSMACAFASLGGFTEARPVGELVAMATSGAVAGLAGAGVVLARPGASGRMAGVIIAGSGAALPVAYILDGEIVPAALLFFALWAGIAAAALKAGWRGVFQLAVGVMAVRLIILSFELASDLLLSGFGLILAGFLILGIGWAALRVSRRFAPEENA